MNGRNWQCTKTKQAAIRFCLNQEIKFLYIKKQKLNKKLYKQYLEYASTWHNGWHLIQTNTDSSFNSFETPACTNMGEHYQIL
jgi:hypothetical protein